MAFRKSRSAVLACCELREWRQYETSPFWRCLRDMRWEATTPVYCEGAVFFQRKVWPVGKVRGKESSAWVRFSGAQAWDFRVLREWRAWVWGVGGVEGGAGGFCFGFGDLFLLFIAAGRWMNFRLMLQPLESLFQRILSYTTRLSSITI